MGIGGSDTWDRTRSLFAEQFESAGTRFVYRKSQKGEAYSVTAEERDQFVGAFDRSIRRAFWIIIGGIVSMAAAVVFVPLLDPGNLPDGAIFAGVFLFIVPYMIHFRWAWAAPARQLTSRTPIAGELDPEQVQRLKFGRMRYRQLAGAAGGGLILSLGAMVRGGSPAGWSLIWPVFGAAIVLFAAVQALRKWRFGQENPEAHFASPATGFGSISDGPQESARGGRQLFRYLAIATIGLGVVFVAFTPAGKRLAEMPSLVPIIMIGFGWWVLSTVAWGFAKGRIQPVSRGLLTTYERETQPKRFWASMAWNVLFGGFLTWLAFAGLRDSAAQVVQERCYNQNNQFTAQQSVDACTRLITGKASSTYLTKGEELHYRALSEEQLNKRQAALNDYSESIRAEPRRGAAYLNRGLLFLDSGRLDKAVADFSRANQLNPHDVWPLANRGIAYAQMKDAEHAERDFRAVEAKDRANAVVLRGRAVLRVNAGDMAGAVDFLTASLKSDPDNLWALQVRAWAYRQLGDDEHADADIKRYEKLSGRPAFTKIPS